MSERSFACSKVQWLSHSPCPTKQGEVSKKKRLEKQLHWTLHYTCTRTLIQHSILFFCHNLIACLETPRSLPLFVFLLIVGKRDHRGRVQEYSVLSYDNKWGEIISINSKPINLMLSSVGSHQFPLHITKILVNNNNDHRWRGPSNYLKSKYNVQIGCITFDPSC